MGYVYTLIFIINGQFSQIAGFNTYEDCREAVNDVKIVAAFAEVKTGQSFKCIRVVHK